MIFEIGGKPADGLHCRYLEFVQIIENCVNAVDGGTRFLVLSIFLEGIQLFDLLWVYFYIVNCDGVEPSHDEEQYRSVQFTGQVEFQFS